MPEKCCRRNYPHTKMAEENNEHIDQFFREQFDQVEVRYNAAHWDQLQRALAAAGAAGVVASTSDNFWIKLKKIFGSPKALLLTTLASAIVITTIILLNNKPEMPVVPQIEKSNLVTHDSLQIVIVDGDTFFIQPQTAENQGIKLKEKNTILPLDTNIRNVPIKMDSIDSVRVDTTKLKNYIFW